MTNWPALDVILNVKDYCQITIDIFLEYADKNFKGKPLWKSMKINFKYWSKQNWDILNDKTWIKILWYYIPRRVWIEESDDQFDKLMRLYLTQIYDVYLIDWDMDCINLVAQSYSKIFGGIAL